MVLVVSGWLYSRRHRTPPPDPGIQTIHARRTATPPTIDGRLDAAEWQGAEVTPAFVRFDNGVEVPLACTARLLWDSDALYVGFDADDEDLIATFTGRDDPLYTEDVFEVFLDPDGDGKFYTELEVSPRGVLFDALFPSHRKDLERSKRFTLDGFKAAVTLRGSLDTPGGDAGWSGELRIPFASVSHAPRRPPQPGDTWRINLYRIDMHGKDDGHWTAWTTTQSSDFHTLNRFGTVVFE